MMSSASSAAAKSGVLGEEPVAGVHRFGAGRLAGGDDLVDREVGIAGRRAADVDGLVGELDVHGVAIGIGIDRDGADAHALGSLDDATGDFAAIGNEDGGEHQAKVPEISATIST